MNLIRFLFIILSIVLILLLNKYLFLPDFNQVCEYALCCSLNIPVKSNYSKDKFYHVIDKDQLELFSKNIQDVLVGSLLALLGLIGLLALLGKNIKEMEIFKNNIT